MRRVLLVGAVLLALALGVAGGYYTGDRLESPEPSASGDAEPLGSPTTPTTPTPSLPVKTPVPSDVPGLETGLDYRQHAFTVTSKGHQSVQLSIETPDGWRLTRNPKMPAEVKYLDQRNERGVRVEAVEPPTQTPQDARAQLVIGLKQSQPPENDLKILSQTDEDVEGEDGEPRAVSTLIYTFIPVKTLRYVIVRWIAGSDGLTSIEMSITGLPQDAPGLDEVLRTATRTVHEIG